MLQKLQEIIGKLRKISIFIIKGNIFEPNIKQKYFIFRKQTNNINLYNVLSKHIELIQIQVIIVAGGYLQRIYIQTINYIEK